MHLLRSTVILGFVLVIKCCDALFSPLKRINRRLHEGLNSIKRLSSILRNRKKEQQEALIPVEVHQTAVATYVPPPLLYKPPLRVKVKYFFFGTIFSLMFAFFPLLFVIFLQDLPNPNGLDVRDIPQTTKIYDRNGILLYQIYAQQNRTLVKLKDIPKSLQDATLAIEDKNFYSHPGFDIQAITRAFIENVSGRSFQGGSTITQQLIKSSMLTPEQRVSRKIKEIILAFWTERIYTKEQILEMYFNQIPYGGTAWGAEAAAEVYFGKPVQQLTLAESAFLAGITAAPSLYSPYGENPTLWKNRQKEVLNRMVLLGYISESEAKEAEKQVLTFKPIQNPMKAPHFVQYVKDYLVNRYGLPMVERGGLTVITSLDLNTQEEAQVIVSDEVEKAAYLQVSNGAALITDPRNGDILAMVGSKDYDDPNGGKVNLATSLRQPGSTVKVITYSAALEHGFTAASVLDDSRITFPNPGGEPYTPVNYDGRYRGRIPLRGALANSLNIPAVKTLNQIGIPTMVDLARDMGVRSWNNPDGYGLSVTLGGAEATMLDMATVFGTLSQNGKRVDLNPILKITDAEGSVLEEKKTISKSQVLDESVAFIISDILADNQSRAPTFGTNSILTIPGHTVSVKTGTSDNKRDNWTIGYTDKLVVTVWVGNNDNSPMSPTLASGITGAAPIWNRIMSSLLTKKPEGKRVIPAGITQKACFGRMEYFVRGTENQATCSRSPETTPMPLPIWRRFR